MKRREIVTFNFHGRNERDDNRENFSMFFPCARMVNEIRRGKQLIIITKRCPLFYRFAADSAFRSLQRVVDELLMLVVRAISEMSAETRYKSDVARREYSWLVIVRSW